MSYRNNSTLKLTGLYGGPDLTITTEQHVGGNEWLTFVLSRGDEPPLRISIENISEARAIASFIDGAVRQYEFALLARAGGRT